MTNRAAHQAQLQVIEHQNEELRETIDSSMHTKRASTLKLETAMNALNLSKGDAKRFIEVQLSCEAQLYLRPAVLQHQPKIILIVVVCRLPTGKEPCCVQRQLHCGWSLCMMTQTSQQTH